MSTEEILFGIVVMLVGITAGFLACLYFFKRGGGAKPRLVIRLAEQARVDARTVGVDLRMRLGTYDVQNIMIFVLKITNEGPGDVVVGNPDGEDDQNQRPWIDLPYNVRTIVAPWTDSGETARADVRIARELQPGDRDRQRIYVHVHRLADGATVSATLVSTFRGSAEVPSYGRSALHFEPGFLPDVTIVGAGLIRG